MDNIILILLVIAAVKFVVFGTLIYLVFREDIKGYFSEKKPAKNTVPVCMYCQSTWTKAVDEGQTRWDDSELVLVTTYECQHCHLPFWHVERVSTISLNR